MRKLGLFTILIPHRSEKCSAMLSIGPSWRLSNVTFSISYWSATLPVAKAAFMRMSPESLP